MVSLEVSLFGVVSALAHTKRMKQLKNEECLHITLIVRMGLHREDLGFTVVHVGFVVN